jgi:hypothetical protein
VQTHSFWWSVRKPQGQGFIAATSMTDGIIDRAEGAGDGDVAVFQRLAHDLEDVAPEFRQLVEEQDPIVSPLDRTDFGG